MELRRQKFRLAQTRSVDRTQVKPVQQNDFRRQDFAVRESVRLAARDEVESVDQRLRAGHSNIAGASRETWSLTDGIRQKEKWWQQRVRTISGMIPGWRSRRRI